MNVCPAVLPGRHPHLPAHTNACVLTQSFSLNSWMTTGQGQGSGKGYQKEGNVNTMSLGEEGWQSVVTKRLVWQKRKQYTGHHARIEARNLVEAC